jgi:serine protease AprX
MTMRRLSLPLVALLALCLSLLVAFSLPASASAGDGTGERKIEKRLAKLAERKGKDELVEVIVRGPDSNRIYRKLARKGTLLPLVGGVATSVKVKDLEKLAADPEISFVFADAPVQPLGGPVDYHDLRTTFNQSDKAHKVWDKGYDGSGVGIAVIDSGVAPTGDFAGRLTQVTMSGQPWSNDDVVGHGSLVAGVAAGKASSGRYIGVAPGANVYALNVANPNGVNSSDVVAALGWVYENGRTYNIRVVNLSLGESIPSSYKQSMLDLAIERVWAAGIVVVVSSGNGGPGMIDFAPANDPLAITVGATDHRGTSSTSDDVLASFTAYGTTVDGISKPEVLAPGRLIGSVLPSGTVLYGLAPLLNLLDPGYAKISGTSFSAPQVAGAAALLLQKYPHWSPDQVKKALVDKARLVSGTSLRAMDVEAAAAVSNPGLANQGVPALVCAPDSTCLPDDGSSTVASLWNSGTWNSGTWNSGTWNLSTWNSGTWNSGTWNSGTWNSGTWNSGTWNSGTWNSGTWNSGTWNSGTWNSATWNSAAWDDPEDVLPEPEEPTAEPAAESAAEPEPDPESAAPTEEAPSS